MLSMAFLVLESDTCCVLVVVGFTFVLSIVLWSSPFRSAVVHVFCPVGGKGPLLMLVAVISIAIEAGENPGLPEDFEVCITLAVVPTELPWLTGFSFV